MGNQAAKSKKHKVQITADAIHGSQQRQQQQQQQQPPNLADHRHSLPVSEAHKLMVQPRPGQSPRPQSIAVAASAAARHSIGPVATAPAAEAPGKLLENSTMTADIQLVLDQLIDKKPKYALLRQLDFSELDERARFVVFEAACDLLDQAKTIDSLREEGRLMRSNFSVVRRVASIDHLDSNPRHRRVASQELASCINQELQRKPPRLAAAAEVPDSSPGASSSGGGGGGLLADLVRGFLQLERQFLESARQELLSRRGQFADAGAACRATHRLLAAMLDAAESLHRRRLDELVETVTSPTDARGMQVLRARLKLPTGESRAIRASAGQLLSQAGDLCQLPWDSLVDAGQFPAFRQAPSNATSFLSNCAAWCWRAVCSNLGRISVACVDEGAQFRAEAHRAELGLGTGRPVACCLWPGLLQNRTTVICKALVQTAAGPAAGPATGPAAAAVSSQRL